MKIREAVYLTEVTSLRRAGAGRRQAILVRAAGARVHHTSIMRAVCESRGAVGRCRGSEAVALNRPGFFGSNCIVRTTESQNAEPASSNGGPQGLFEKSAAPGGRCVGHSCLILAVRISRPHFSVSSAICLANSAGELAKTVTPRSPSRALNVVSASAALISWLSLSTISEGVSLGATMPAHPLAS